MPAPYRKSRKTDRRERHRRFLRFSVLKQARTRVLRSSSGIFCTVRSPARSLARPALFKSTGAQHPPPLSRCGADASREIFPVLRHFGRERNILVFHGLVEVLHRIVIAVVDLVSVCVIAHGAAAPGGLLPALIGGICLLDRIAAVRLVGIGAGPDPLQPAALGVSLPRDPPLGVVGGVQPVGLGLAVAFIADVGELIPPVRRRYRTSASLRQRFPARRRRYSSQGFRAHRSRTQSGRSCRSRPSAVR